MSWRKAIWAACIAALFGLAFWRNRKVYAKHSRLWCGIKSAIDVTLVLGLAFRVPVLLCAYVIMWLTKPLNKQPVLRTTVGAIIGITVAFLSGFAVELVVVAGVFAVDMVTGGVWKYWSGISTEKIDWRAELFGKRFARQAA
jgi:hypothetical protein